MKSFLLIFIVSALLSSCTPRPVAPPAPRDNEVTVGVVDGTIITDKMLEDRIKAIEKAYPRSYSTLARKKDLLTEMMNIELLYKEALRMGLDKKYEFKSRLADLYIREISEKSRDEMSEDKLQKFFEDNRAAVEQISARHILIKADPNLASKEKEKIRQKLEGIRKEALKDPSQFAALARKYSEDPSKDNGGELGFFQRNRMVPEFSEAAFKLKNINDISPVVETRFGFHIIQLSGDRRGFEPYRSLIQDRFLRQTQQERLSSALDQLKKGKKFQIFEDQLAKISPLPIEIKTDPLELIPESGQHGSGKK